MSRCADAKPNRYFTFFKKYSIVLCTVGVDARGVRVLFAIKGIAGMGIDKAWCLAQGVSSAC